MPRRAPAKPPLTEAASSGDRLATLQALRDLLAVTVLAADPPARASLAKQLRDTLAEIAALSAGKEVSASDDLAERRRARLRGAGAAPADPAGRGGQQQRS